MTLRRIHRARLRAARCAVVVALLSALTAEISAPFDTRAASTALAATFLNLRSLPSTTSLILMIVPPEAALRVSGDASSGFYPVVYGENSGWVATELVQVDARSAPAAAASIDQSRLLPQGMAVLVESVNLRAGPGVDHEALRVIDAGTEVEATGEMSGAYERVKLGNETGWVRSVYVDRGPEPEEDGLRQAEIMSAAIAIGHPLVAPGLTMIADAEIVLRSEPVGTSEKLDVVPVNSELTLTGNQAEGFLEAEFGSKTGWVASGYLRRVEPPDSGPSHVPVLMYHSIQETGAAYQVTAAQLEEQLHWLSQNGYQSVTSADLLAWMTFGIPLPEKPVMITIDDGNASDWLFLELLERYGFEGVFALPNYAQMTAAQIRTLDRAGEVCGHTVSHQNLSTLDYDGQYAEIVENKEFLEDVLGNEVTCFAYPFGAYDGLTPYVVIEAGFLMAFDVSGGPQPLDGSLDRWHILRINVNGSGTLDDFIASLEA